MYTMKIGKFVKMGSNSSILLLSLIEDILNLSKIDAGTFSINIAEFCIKDLIDEVYEIYHFQCQQKNLQLEVNIDERLVNREVSSDRSRLKQILLNFMSNAFKFTFEGKIVIS